MASTYPSAVATLTNPSATDKLNSPSHSSIHTAVNTEAIQIQTFVGTLSSAVGTLVYDVRAAASNGGGHVQTASKGGTGQTSFTKGDILVATSASVLTKLAISGTDGYALVADSTQAAGVKWALPGNLPSVLTVSTSSVFTYVAPSVFSYIRVRMVGGGGGVGGGTYGGAGGGAGYAESFIPASSVAATVTVVVAAGGATSSVGGTTAFGSILTAAGGAGGTNDPGSGNTTGGASGGVGVGGQINLTGGSSTGQERGVATTTNATGGIAPLLSPYGNGASGAGGANSRAASTGLIIIETY